jgi:hypothetical protein
MNFKQIFFMMNEYNNQPQVAGESDKFTFFCPECNSMRQLAKVEIGKVIECEACCEMVKIAYPEIRPCPKCQKSIKLKARVCKHCKQRVMPFVDPLTIEFKTSEVKSIAATPPKVKNRFSRQLQALSFGLLGMGGGFAVGILGTRSLAKITHRHITGNADYIVATILAIYLAIRLYRAKK